MLSRHSLELIAATIGLTVECLYGWVGGDNQIILSSAIIKSTISEILPEIIAIKDTKDVESAKSF